MLPAGVVVDDVVDGVVDEVGVVGEVADVGEVVEVAEEGVVGEVVGVVGEVAEVGEVDPVVLEPLDGVVDDTDADAVVSVVLEVVVGQVRVLQVDVIVAGPEHSFPPFLGAGFVQERELVITPEPHVAEQEPVTQGVYPPSTTETSGPIIMQLTSMSYWQNFVNVTIYTKHA